MRGQLWTPLWLAAHNEGCTEPELALSKIKVLFHRQHFQHAKSCMELHEHTSTHIWHASQEHLPAIKCCPQPCPSTAREPHGRHSLLFPNTYFPLPLHLSYPPSSRASSHAQGEHSWSPCHADSEGCAV